MPFACWRSADKYKPDFSGGDLTNFEMDLGVFLATRGDYAWLGYGWMGCGCGWEHNGKMPCDFYQRPEILDRDFGERTREILITRAL